MSLSLVMKLCVALVLASSTITTCLAEDQQHEVAYIRSLKHSRRAAKAELAEAGPSTLAKRGPTYHGRATYYAAGLGACGNYNSGSDFIVALNAAQYGDLGQRSSWCGKSIAITYNGNTQYATVQDACPSCPYGGLDMSEGLFRAFANPSVGVFQMSWTANDGSDDDNNNGKKTSTSSTPAWTPRPSPTSTWSSPAWTPSTTSTRRASSSSSSSSAARSSAPTSSTASTTTPASSSSSTSSSSSASTSTSSSASDGSDSHANNLDSFALIYQGLNHMAVAAAS
ncbi:uncharacterized protein UMAG_00567 [Mycosarcoma maydis]|uniref:B2-aldehyde-forming enzyme n=1 Tax=Mycosarcoma maydis TaxID=5270 RepID=A0A0D1E8K9_MYCMD|nr:uncharacterized protein UMAG_00567 [Ustilago maydis 521]KIS72149.1 hypothetical protein UMAG_00567 [Ustilago maydis 521]|eukprot:XP_011386397.1 hypothetical protein UMAG_00567 [Ustilago maydis 521]